MADDDNDDKAYRWETFKRYSHNIQHISLDLGTNCKKMKMVRLNWKTLSPNAVASKAPARPSNAVLSVTLSFLWICLPLWLCLT